MLKIIFYLFTFRISNNYYKHFRLYNLKDNDNDIYKNINNDINNIMNNSNNIMNNIMNNISLSDSIMNNISSYDKDSFLIKNNSLVKGYPKNLYSGMDQSKEHLNYNPTNNTHYIDNLYNNVLSEYNLTEKIIRKNNINLYKKNILDKLTSNISIINKLNYVEDHNKHFNDTITGCNMYNGNLMKDWEFDF